MMVERGAQKKNFEGIMIIMRRARAQNNNGLTDMINMTLLRGPGAKVRTMANGGR
jgi:hypothetical protein